MESSPQGGPGEARGGPPGAMRCRYGWTQMIGQVPPPPSSQMPPPPPPGGVPFMYSNRHAASRGSLLTVGRQDISEPDIGEPELRQQRSDCSLYSCLQSPGQSGTIDGLWCHWLRKSAVSGERRVGSTH